MSRGVYLIRNKSRKAQHRTLTIQHAQSQPNLNLIDANPDFTFEVFVQSWVPDIGSELDAIWQSKASRHESNLIYTKILKNFVHRSLANEVLASFPDIRTIVRLFSRSYWRTTYAGISSALALKLGTELLMENAKIDSFDLVIFWRPDLVLLSPLKLSNYDPEYIHCNHYLDRMGDFHWIFAPKNLELFPKLFESIRSKGYHKLHTWIRDFFDQETKSVYGESRYLEDGVIAGKDQEVLRKVNEVGIPFFEVEKFGVTMDQYSKY